ncbi:MAG TPA: ACT domain-containing protein [Candidatus Limnocylindrales bacterium]
MVWFTVQLEDRPGALARLAEALGQRQVNITGIVGVAEDTEGALMLTTSDPAATRDAFAALGLTYEEHEPGEGLAPEVRRGLADRGMDLAG